MGGGKTTSTEAEIPDELKPLFEALVSELLGPVGQSGDILTQALQPGGRFAIPEVTPLEQRFQNLVGQRLTSAASQGLLRPQPLPELTGAANALAVRPSIDIPQASQALAGQGSALEQLAQASLPTRTTALPIFNTQIANAQRALNRNPPQLPRGPQAKL